MPKQTFFNLPEEKRRLIIDLAINEFADHSYKEASISRIVKNAGIAKGSFYQYFDDKKDLYLFLIHLSMEQKTAFFNKFTPPQNMGAFDYLRWVFKRRVQFEVTNPKLNRIAYKAVYGDAPMLTEVLIEGETQANAFSQALLARGQAEGDLDPNLDTELAAFILNSVFMHLGDYLLERLEVSPEELIRDEPFLFESPEAEAIFDGIMEILEKGMAGRKN
ncbi:MAG: TetR/AcrR family transcriptional regulator [Anaerolineales bacterium]|nr:TetR/AcrR family transcriptional regulator [Anaerolineales bacterium]MCA9927396.1 TetR/AcrR family transcriptional regulator [Anaerolineales bacterium]